MKTTFYKKAGRKYIPVSEYDSELLDGFPIGTTTMIHSYQNGQSRRYDIDPALAPMVAACMVLGESIKDIIVKASEYKPAKTLLTVEQREAWEALNKSFGDQSVTLVGPSMNDIAESILKAISTKAEELLSNESTKASYEHFLTIATLSKK